MPLKDQHGIYTCEQGHINLVVQDNTVLYNAARWKGQTHNQSMYGTAIIVNGNPSETGHAEFENEFVIVQGNTLQLMPHGNGIDVASSDGSFKKGRPTFAVPVGHFPRKVHIKDNTITGTGEWATVSIAGCLGRTDAFVVGNTIDEVSSTANAPSVQADKLKSLTLTGNTLPSRILPSWKKEVSSTISVSEVGDVSIVANVLGPATIVPKGSMPGRGCFVPGLSNISSAISSVESFGTGCPSGTVLPLATTTATEITVWCADGGLARSLIFGGRVTSVVNASNIDAILITIQAASVHQNLPAHSVEVRTASGAPVSFRAVSL